MKIGTNGIIVFTMYELQLDQIDKVIFTFSGIEKVEKEYPSPYVTYADNRFFVGLTQEDTLILSRRSNKIRVQAEAQLCYKNGAVGKSDIISFMLDETLNTNLIAGNSPSRNVKDIEFHYENGVVIIGGAGLSEARVREIIAGYHYLDSSALANYATLSDLNTALNNYVETNNLNTAIATYLTENLDLSDYATKAEVAQDYVSKSGLTETLQDYAQSSDLSNFVTTSGLATELSGYAQSTDLANYVTSSGLATELENYAPSSALNNYVTSTSLQTELAGYVTDSELTEAIVNASTNGTVDLTGYVTETGLATELEGYVETTDLANYVTGTALNTALGDYVTDSELNTALSEYVTDTELTSTLADYVETSDLSNYVTSAALQTELAGYVEDSDLASYVTSTALNTKLEDYAKTTDLNSYVTSSALATELNGYVETSDLTNYVQSSALNNYVTSSALATELDGYVETSDLSDYVTSSALTTRLGSYATTSSLSSYETKSELNTTLGSYALKSEIPSGASVYDTMPSTNALLEMGTANSGAGTKFRTLSFYELGDGAGGNYHVSSNFDAFQKIGCRVITGTLNGTETTVYLKYLDSTCTHTVDVTKLGVRTYLNASIYTSLSAASAASAKANTYATINSDILDSIYYGNSQYPTQGFTLKFPKGIFYFERTIKLGWSGTNGTPNDTDGIASSSGFNLVGAERPYHKQSNKYNKSNQTYSSDIGDINRGNKGGTVLQFPYLENGKAAILAGNSSIQNVLILGHRELYNLRFKRNQTYDHNENVEDEVIAQVSDGNGGTTAYKTYGIYCVGGAQIKDVFVGNFYYGIKNKDNLAINCAWQNIKLMQCHFGLTFGTDTKITGVYGWNCYAFLHCKNASIASVVQARCDSCHTMLLMSGGNSKCTFVDFDADYCTSSMVLVTGDTSITDGTDAGSAKGCSFIGFHGRCCAFKTFDKTASPSEEITAASLTSSNSEHCGVFHVGQNSYFRNNYILAAAGGGTPFDTSDATDANGHTNHLNYATPMILIAYSTTRHENGKSLFGNIVDVMSSSDDENLDDSAAYIKRIIQQSGTSSSYFKPFSGTVRTGCGMYTLTDGTVYKPTMTAQT